MFITGNGSGSTTYVKDMKLSLWKSTIVLSKYYINLNIMFITFKRLFWLIPFVIIKSVYSVNLQYGINRASHKGSYLLIKCG